MYLTFPQPMISRFLMDHVLIEKRLSLLGAVIALMAVVALVQGLSGLLQGFFSTRFQQSVTLDIQKDLLERTLSLPKTFFDGARTGYLISRIQNGANGVQWFFSGTVVQLLTQSIRFFGGLIFLFYLEWRIAVPVTLSLPAPIETADLVIRLDGKGVAAPDVPDMPDVQGPENSNIF